MLVEHARNNKLSKMYKNFKKKLQNDRIRKKMKLHTKLKQQESKLLNKILKIFR